MRPFKDSTIKYQEEALEDSLIFWGDEKAGDIICLRKRWFLMLGWVLAPLESGPAPQA